VALRKPVPADLSVSDRILMDARTVQHVLDISRSTLMRLVAGQCRVATEFPKPFRPYGRKALYWERVAVERWAAEQIAAAAK
jgi:predicted DNA-binding transcriptional regulator AlpA